MARSIAGPESPGMKHERHPDHEPSACESEYRPQAPRPNRKTRLFLAEVPRRRQEERHHRRGRRDEPSPHDHYRNCQVPDQKHRQPRRPQNRFEPRSGEAMIGRAVRQADHCDERRQDAGRDTGQGLGKKARGPDHRPAEQDYRGRVHVITVLPGEVRAAQAVAYASLAEVFVLLARAIR